MSDWPHILIGTSTDMTAALFPPDLRARLAACGTVTTGRAAADAAADVLITGWGSPPLTADVLGGTPRLRLVVHAAGSVKGLVTPTVWERGIAVSSAADANAGPVAEYAYALVVLAAKQALTSAASYAARGGRAGWPVFQDRRGADGLTVGVVGASRIGRRVVARLRSASAGYRVLLHDPCVPPDEAKRLGAELVDDVDALCGASRVVTLHAPELPETRGLLNAERLALIPDGGTVVNTARGSLVDTESLVRECASGRLNAFLDVTDPEPLPHGHQLLALPNVLVTPHIAGAQGSEVRRLGAYAVEEVERWVLGLPLRGAVRRADLDRSA
ncbi:hydroxyacid dehydrogenase [Streptomyces cinnamoneus]|uniref:Hydroxyacid dehydrogenase n=1 Tax=Streptomyces cinnamoneus TaxID=53446 RepID=A0A2G1XK72_STRCJ|nr:hydroxyacid dehydrogenase [Streptomyces cinnamoneus]PHQ51635.1 hydroxyacid dehydrogenase [Streptomyces cinnamoneus]PPT14339.1 hydroxyacid dehydrogenase [Streptomyces cinnamoneus]